MSRPGSAVTVLAAVLAGLAAGFAAADLTTDRGEGTAARATPLAVLGSGPTVPVATDLPALPRLPELVVDPPPASGGRLLAPRPVLHQRAGHLVR